MTKTAAQHHSSPGSDGVNAFRPAVLILVGAPGAGKSSFSAALQAACPGWWQRVNQVSPPTTIHQLSPPCCQATMDCGRSECVAHNPLKRTLVLCRTLWLEAGTEAHARSVLQPQGRHSWLDKVPSSIAVTGTFLSAWTSRPWQRKWAAR